MTLHRVHTAHAILRMNINNNAFAGGSLYGGVYTELRPRALYGGVCTGETGLGSCAVGERGSGGGPCLVRSFQREQTLVIHYLTLSLQSLKTGFTRFLYLLQETSATLPSPAHKTPSNSPARSATAVETRQKTEQKMNKPQNKGVGER